MELRDRKKIVSLKANLAKYEDGTPGSYGLPGYEWQNGPQYVPNTFVQFKAPNPSNEYSTGSSNYYNNPLQIIGHNLGRGQNIASSHFDNAVNSNSGINSVTSATDIDSGEITPPKATKGGGAPSAAGIANAGMATLGAGLTIADTFKYGENADTLYNRGDNMEGNAGGIGYQYKDLDRSREVSEIDKQVKGGVVKSLGAGAAAGGAIGSLAGPVGTAIGTAAGAVIGAVGGILGGASKRKKAMRALVEADNKAYAMKNFNRDVALTQSIRLQNAKETGPFNQTYKFKDGKLPGFSGGKAVQSAMGLVNEKQNSWGSAGETIVDTLTGAYHTIPGKPNFKDTFPMFARGRDAVLSNHGASQYFQATKDLEGAIQMDNMYRAGGLTNFRNGKMPRFKGGFEGPWSNIVPSAFGMLAGAGQYFDAEGQSIRTPNIYAGNQYEHDAMATLAELRENPLPTLNQLRDAEARTNSAISQSGGLSAAQRLLSRASTLNTTQGNMAKYLAQVQAQNNAYKQAYATTALQTGAQNAQRKMAASQFAEDMTAKAHAARQQGMQTGISNMLAQLQNYYANEFKRNQFNETLGLYRDQHELEKAKFNAMFPNKSTPIDTYINPNYTTSQQEDLFDAAMRDHQNAFERDMKSRGFFYDPSRHNAIQRAAYNAYRNSNAIPQIEMPDFSVMDNLMQQKINKMNKKRR